MPNDHKNIPTAPEIPNGFKIANGHEIIPNFSVSSPYKTIPKFGFLIRKYTIWQP
jgi:hypothetical protein